MVIETALKGRTELADSAADRLTQIKVVGVGGGGTNAVNRMIEEDIPEIDFVASIAPTRIRIGDRLTRGLGAGGDHTLGMLAAEESRDEVAKAMDGADMPWHSHYRHSHQAFYL